MSATGNWPLEHVSFSRQFMMIVAAILLCAMAGMGSWLGRQIEASAINRAAHVTAAYVENVLMVFLRDWSPAGELDEQTRLALDRAFREGRMRNELVRFKLWDASGLILYSEDRTQIGRRYAVESSLAEAFEGRVHSHITYPGRADHQPERDQGSRLLEVYVPVRAGPGGPVKAVAEFYHAVDALDEEILAAKWRSWLLVAIGGTALYAVLFTRVRRASDTIVEQQRSLREQLDQLRASLARNEQMRNRLREAGARTTALNEQMLHRIAADLHDGPAQDLSYALLRFDDMARGCAGCERVGSDVEHDLRTIPRALTSSLDELRAIAAGLGAPGIAELSLSDTARRAIREGERKRGGPVDALVDDFPEKTSVAARITLYRLLQESIANSSQHAPGSPIHVRVRRTGNDAAVEVTDEGAGFDAATAVKAGRLGLALMRERVRLVGGSFEIEATPGRGTSIRATIPLGTEETAHA